MKQHPLRHSCLSFSEADTADFAADLAAALKPGDTVFLSGALGMGKSVFARALIRTLTRTLGLDVPSPTFTLIQTYDTDAGPLSHFDLYRIEDPDELWELGWEDALAGITVVEWPERLGNSLAPRDRLEIVFAPSSEKPGARTITLAPYGTWKDRL